MTLLFLKRLNDQFEERPEELEGEGRSKADAWENPDRHSFFVLKEARRNVIANTFQNIVKR
jgi:hypothetical protein